MAKTQSSSHGLLVALTFPVATPTTMTLSPCATNSGGFENGFHRLRGCPKQELKSTAPMVRARQEPVLAWNNPFDILGRQGQESSLVAAAHRCEEVLHGLDILFDAPRNLFIVLDYSVSDLPDTLYGDLSMNVVATAQPMSTFRARSQVPAPLLAKPIIIRPSDSSVGATCSANVERRQAEAFKKGRDACLRVRIVGRDERIETSAFREDMTENGVEGLHDMRTCGKGLGRLLRT